MAFPIYQFILLSGLCAYLVYYFSGPSVSIHIKIWSLLTWILNFGIVLLVPEDLFQSLMHHEKNNFRQSQQYRLIGIEYLFLYWSVYILTWTIIPLLQEWQNSGDLGSWDRLKRSLKVNGVFYLYMLIGGVIVLLLMMWAKIGQDMGLLTYLKCLATSFGIFLLMIFVGYAIVEIPRQLWISADTNQYILYLYRKVIQLQDQKAQAQFQFRKIVSYIVVSDQKATDQSLIKQYCVASLNQIPKQLKRLFPKNPNNFLTEINYFKDYPFDIESAIEHHRLIKRVIGHLRRLNKTQEDLLYNCVLFEDVKQSKQTEKTYLSTSLFKSKKIHYIWYCQIRTPIKKALAILFVIGALIVLVCQTQIFLTKENSVLSWIPHLKNLFLIRILSLLIISFISYMANYSLFQLKISNLYGLYKHESDGPSLMFATINFSRVGVAIIFNFLDMIKRKTIFTEVMNTVDMGAFDDWILKGLPGTLWVIVLIQLFQFMGSISEDVRSTRFDGFQRY